MNSSYQYGFVTNIENEAFEKGLNEEVIRRASKLRNEPEFLLNFRLKAYAQLQKMKEPHWAELHFEPVDLQNIVYYSAPKMKKEHENIEDVDPELLETFEKLGIPLDEQKRLANVAVDAVFDSVSIYTSHKKKLLEYGIIFCSISDAVKEYPELIEEYLGSVVPAADNYFAALNSAVFSDGSFVYIPPGVQSPMDLSTYFRINNQEAGQFERTLIIADEGASVSYLEGCTAPEFSTNQLHSAIVELVAKDNASIKYSTVQNWYAGDKETGKGGVYNFVTKRGKCAGKKSHISWTQVETGSAITWKYPSCILAGDDSVGEFYSVALTNGKMQADTGTKMIHIGKNTRSTIISKGISADGSSNAYRGLVDIRKNAKNARNYTECDSMLVGNQSAAHTFPTINVANPSAKVEHEATTSRISEDQLFYFESRGIRREDAIQAMVSGFCKDVFKELPGEFATEAQQLLLLKLEKSVG
ncbi:MAG: Fe-S cluster assembly protein SufB [Fibrobacter sp.]|jgi:Fe-S cluster assembly protein SufB|nr:Fe-S cluster assembly protein SufB [Fibrobacter sp.]